LKLESFFIFGDYPRQKDWEERVCTPCGRCSIASIFCIRQEEFSPVSAFLWLPGAHARVFVETFCPCRILGLRMVDGVRTSFTVSFVVCITLIASLRPRYHQPFSSCILDSRGPGFMPSLTLISVASLYCVAEK